MQSFGSFSGSWQDLNSKFYSKFKIYAMDLQTNTSIDKEYVDHAVKMKPKWCLLADSPTLQKFKLVHEEVMNIVES